MCMSVLLVLYAYAWCLQRPEESTGSSGFRFTDGYVPSSKSWEPNVGPVEKQPVLLPTELSLQSNHCDLYVSLSSLQLHILGQPGK